MKREPAAYLWDIQNACLLARRFVFEITPSGYTTNLLVQSAVERQLQNMGEAVAQLAKLAPELAAQLPQHREIIGFRNVLVHGYAGLNHAEIWRVLHESLPALEAAATALLQTQSQHPTS
jgi:uncharacterized protein with HEPN domain